MKNATFGRLSIVYDLGCIFFGAYAVVQKFNIPIQIQPHALMALSLISWVQILMYSQCVTPDCHRHLYHGSRGVTGKCNSGHS